MGRWNPRQASEPLEVEGEEPEELHKVVRIKSALARTSNARRAGPLGGFVFGILPPCFLPREKGTWAQTGRGRASRLFGRDPRACPSRYIIGPHSRCACARGAGDVDLNGSRIAVVPLIGLRYRLRR